MKYVIIAQAEKLVYLEARLVVEIPDGVAMHEDKIQDLCHEPIDDFVNDQGVDWEENDYEWPSYTGIDSVEVADDPDEDADICFVLTKDGSLVPEGETVDGTSE